ncbi:MAG: DUF547 domain-containing protein [Candidatus Dadabacteria bacterium]|nr:MAG: DUF547 domain-containing protein [Candidatus Dadabacteria bacterium]
MDPFEHTEARLRPQIDDDGFVNYDALVREGACARAIQAFAEQTWPQDPAGPAFWINAYNLLTLALVCDHWPIRSLGELHRVRPLPVAVALKQTVWDRERFAVAGRNLTLNDIEHRILRKQFAEPRIHAALVCAAVSCPPLRAELYRDECLEEQLTDQMRRFLACRRTHRYDPASHTWVISPIFLWYARDFGRSRAQRLEWLLAYAPKPVRHGTRERGRPPRIRYSDYDWSLNMQR